MIIKKLLTIIFLMQAFCFGCNAQEQKSFHEYQGVFFRISGNGLEKPSYILGTMHTIPGDFVYTLPDFEKIIGSVEQLVTEYDFKKQNKNLYKKRSFSKEQVDSLYRHIMSLYTRKDGTIRSFFDDLSRKEKDQVAGSLRYWGFTDRSSWTFENVEKNFRTACMKKRLEVINSEGYDFKIWDSPIDHYLMDSIAPAYHLPLVDLDKKDACNRYSESKKRAERVEKLFSAKTSRKTYSRYLGMVILIYREYEVTKNSSLHNYLEGNNADIKYSKSEPGEMKERNAWWMEQIPGLIQDKPSFIAVGLAHLMDGADYRGILPQLEEMGYTIERLK